MRPIVLLACLAAPLSGEVKFTERPTAVVEGDSVRIAFAASEAADVEVAVLDAAGRIVRHLAAGKLGPNAPAPLKANSLRQSLVWDRTDDGRRAVRGACTVRVALGLGGEVERHLADEPYSFRTIVALAVNADGELFVIDSQFTYGGGGIRVFSREGKYLRTLLPYSSRLPAERLAAIGQLKLKDGGRLPIVYNAHGQNLHPFTSGLKHQTPAFDPAGRFVFFSAVGTIVEHGPPRHVLFLEPDGGAPKAPGFIGPQIRKARGFMGGSGEGSVRFFDHLAISADGKWIYVSGGRFGSAKHMRHAVGRLRPADPGPPAAWIGEYDKPGSDATHLNDAQGLAVDPEGRLYVADRGNGRIVVHGPDGKRRGAFAVPRPPLQVFVHPRSRHIYVTAGEADTHGRIKTFTLYKLSPFRRGADAPKVLCELSGKDKPVAALDGGADPPRLWLGLRVRYRQELMPVIDRGDRLELGKSIRRAGALAQPMFVAADVPHGKLYVTEFRNRQLQIDLKTQHVREFGKGGEAAVDRDGFVYVIEGYPPRVFLHRYDAEGKAANYPGTDSNKLGPIDTASKGPHVGFRGHTIAPNGDIYIVQMRFYGRGNVVVYSPRGECKNEGLVRNIPNGSGGIAVARDGSVYASANVKPADKLYPDDFAGVLPKTTWVWWRRPRQAPWDRPFHNPYLYHWGSVFKFPPTGGRFYPGYKEPGKDGRPPMDIPKDARVYRTGYLNADVGVAGALWRFHGFAPVPTAGLNWGDPSCTCMGARFALDDFARLFVPDVFRFAVNVLDARGNLIARLGRYGNRDDRGLSFAWPAYAACSGDKLFVSDMANRRVTVVRLTARATATAKIPPGK